jgi:hypothetical protein
MPDTGVIVAGKTYGSAAVARIVFGRSVEWFYANKDREQREQGFPRPISPNGWPKWSGADLLAWLARPKASDAQAAAPGKVVDFASRLRERSQTLAQAARRARLTP